jgi:hypothetical protein
MASALERRPEPMPGLRRLRLWPVPSSLLLALFFVPGCASAPTVPYTLDASPLVFLPAGGADIDDQRGRSATPPIMFTGKTSATGLAIAPGIFRPLPDHGDKDRDRYLTP